MERSPKDKVVVVTGGAQGIGFEIAEEFLKNGAKTVVLLDINETRGNQAVKELIEKYGEGKAAFIKCDVTKDLDTVTEKIFQNYKVDVLVNNAGVLDESSARKTLEINAVAVVEWGMKFWEYMRKDKGGSGGTIFNVASIYGFEIDPFIVFYKTSKWAVLGFTSSLGHSYNYEKSGVRVIALCPGFTKTELLLNISENKVWDFQKKDFNEHVGAQILQTQERVGEAALEVFSIADSGSAWVAKDNKPIEPAPIC